MYFLYQEKKQLFFIPREKIIYFLYQEKKMFIFDTNRKKRIIYD